MLLAGDVDEQATLLQRPAPSAAVLRGRGYYNRLPPAIEAAPRKRHVERRLYLKLPGIRFDEIAPHTADSIAAIIVDVTVYPQYGAGGLARIGGRNIGQNVAALERLWNAWGDLEKALHPRGRACGTLRDHATWSARRVGRCGSTG
jgi:hypothetical protein